MDAPSAARYSSVMARCSVFARLRFPAPRWSLYLLAVVILGPPSALCADTPPDSHSPPPPSAHVLLLSSYHAQYKWTADIFAGIEESLAAFEPPLDISYEYLDTKRQEETEAYYDLFARLLDHKLRHHPITLLILCDNSAFDFVAARRNTLFPSIPVVFCGINNYSPDLRAQIPRSTGVAEVKEMGATLDLIRRLHPRVRSIALISDSTSTSQINATLVREAADQRRLDCLDWSGLDLSLADLLARLSSLPPRTAVFFNSFFRDRTGTSLDPDIILPQIAAASPVPVYTHTDTFIQGGVLGGIAEHARHQGRLAGDLALRILRGEDPDSIPVISRSNLPVLDYAALRRWNLDPRSIPPDTLFINLPPTPFYRQHAALAASIVAAFLLLLAITAALALNVLRRRRAEADREHLIDQLAQSRKMESVGRLAGGIAHDFNNMLGVILGYSEMATEQAADKPDLARSLHEIHQAALRSADLTRQLLAFARRQIVTPQFLDLNAKIDGLLQMLRRLIGEDIVLSWRPGPALGLVQIDPSQFDQILTNLCANARDAISGTGHLIIETSIVELGPGYTHTHPDAPPGTYVMLAVSDNGCGMDRATVDRLFEPYFTTKAIGKGTGLGLATVYGIVQQNHGFIHVYSEPGQGTTFRIYLPRLAEEPAANTPPPAPSPSPLRGHERILLVEDEPALRNMTSRILEAQGYSVQSAANPAEAMHLAEPPAPPFDLLITDVIMPGMNGRDLATHLSTRHPSLRCLFISGYTPNIIVQHGVLEPGVHFLPKPFSMAELSAKVRATLDAPLSLPPP